MTKPDWHCRIGKVTRKGGATVHVLRPEDDGSPAHVIAGLRKATEDFAQMFEADAAGYVVVMWDRAGRYSRGRGNALSSPYAYRLIPAIVHDILTEDTMESVTHGVLRGDK